MSMRLIDIDALGVGRCSPDILPAAYCAGWNGLLNLIEDAPTVNQGRLVVLPCKMGDLLWGVRWFGSNAKVQQAPVTAMNFLDDMTLSITLGKVCSGEYGKGVFPTREDAERALAGKVCEQVQDAIDKHNREAMRKIAAFIEPKEGADHETH